MYQNIAVLLYKASEQWGYVCYPDVEEILEVSEREVHMGSLSTGLSDMFTFHSNDKVNP